MQRSEGGGSFQAVDTLNGKLLCGCDDVHACVVKQLTSVLFPESINKHFSTQLSLLTLH